MKIILVAPGHKKITNSIHGGGQQSCKDIANGLSNLGHEIFLVGHPQSELDSVQKIFPYANDEKNAIQVINAACNDVSPHVILDSSAFHVAHDFDFGVARVNRLPQPRQVGLKYDNTVVNSDWMKQRNPAKVIKTAIKDDDYDKIINTVYHDWNEYVVYAGRDYQFKGYDFVRKLKAAGIPIVSIENVERDVYLRMLTQAKYLLHPSVEDAAPRAPLEAALVGLPTICLNMSGAVDQVIEGHTGYICDDLNVLYQRIMTPRTLSSVGVREAMLEDRSYDNMISEYEQLLKDAISGQKW